MENIKISTVCGLCQGCKTAINLALEENKKHKTTIFKEIVHNKNINNSLRSAGILCCDDIEKLENDSSIIIRAHGEPPQTYAFLKAKNLKVVDGTCKNVTSIHNLISEHSNNGYLIVIVGKYGKTSGIVHPEVLGEMGYATSPPILIEDMSDVSKLNNMTNQKLFVVCQTTFNPQKFKVIEQKILEICKQNNNELIIKNTICGAGLAILKSSLTLAKESDLMIVVGGKHSSNTVELFNNLAKECTAIHIENIDDWLEEINKINFKLSKHCKIGLTAGASTDKAELETLKQLIENYISKL